MFEGTNLGDDGTEGEDGKDDLPADADLPPNDPRAEKRRRRERLRALLNEKLADDDKMVDVVAKTLRKMSPGAIALAGALPLDDDLRAVLERAASG